MKVLLVDRSHAGGIWNVLNPIAAALVGRGDDCLCVRWRGGGEAYADAPPGARVVQIDVPPRRTPLTVVRQARAFRRQFADLLRTERPDAVHTNFVLPGAVARRTARSVLPGARIVATQHELYGSMSPALRLLTRRTLRLADAVAFVSRTTKGSFAGVPLGPGVRGEVIPNGVDFAALDAATAGVQPAGEPEIVCAGRLVPVKGQRALIEALPAVRAAVPGARLTLYGEGPEEGRLRNSAADAGVAGAVRFAGWERREAVWRAIAAAGCAAIPSDGTQEGFGLAAVEAAACGPPVVASDIPVFREVLGPPRPGVAFAPPGEAAAWADRLVAALTTAPDRRPGPRADDFVRRFDRSAMVAGYLRLYDAL